MQPYLKIHWINTQLSKMFLYTGRISRDEFWRYALFCWFVMFTSVFMMNHLPASLNSPDPELVRQTSFYLILPCLSVFLLQAITHVYLFSMKVRRLHDTGLPGMMVGLSAVCELMTFFFLPGAIFQITHAARGDHALLSFFIMLTGWGMTALYIYVAALLPGQKRVNRYGELP